MGRGGFSPELSGEDDSDITLQPNRGKAHRKLRKWDCRIQSSMDCVSWNIHGLCDEQRRGVMARFLHKWGGAMVAFLPGTMPKLCEVQDLNRWGKVFRRAFLQSIWLVDLEVCWLPGIKLWFLRRTHERLHGQQ